MTFNGIHKSYENYDSYFFKQNEVLMDKAICLGSTVFRIDDLGIRIVEFIALRNKMYDFSCGDDSKNKFKGLSKPQSKNIKFEE